MNKAGDFVEYTPCSIVSTICSIPMIDLISDYLLEEADIITVQVSATNQYGESSRSDFVSENAKLIETVPHKPSILPFRGDFTSQNQIHLFITAFAEN